MLLPLTLVLSLEENNSVGLANTDSETRIRGLDISEPSLGSLDADRTVSEENTIQRQPDPLDARGWLRLRVGPRARWHRIMVLRNPFLPCLGS